METEIKNNERLRELRLVKIEMFFWVVLVVIEVALYLVEIFFGDGKPALIEITRLSKSSVGEFAIPLYNYLLLIFFTIITPILSKLTFEKLPFERIRNQKKIKIIENNTSDVILKEGIDDKTTSTTEKLGFLTTNDNRLVYIAESKSISERIYRSSGVNLFVGCLIALLGVFVFYILNAFSYSSHETALNQKLLDYLPRFGALFFIEYIAFFFLKQYKNTIEEFRYYEGIKRRRQDDYNLIGLLERFKDKDSVLNFLIENSKNVNHNILKKDETTQVIEIQKISNLETDIFGKLIDLVKQVKK